MTESESVALPLGDTPIFLFPQKTAKSIRSFHVPRVLSCVILADFLLFGKRFYSHFSTFFNFPAKKPISPPFRPSLSLIMDAERIYPEVHNYVTQRNRREKRLCGKGTARRLPGRMSLPEIPCRQIPAVQPRDGKEQRLHRIFRGRGLRRLDRRRGRFKAHAHRRTQKLRPIFRRAPRLFGGRRLPGYRIRSRHGKFRRHPADYRHGQNLPRRRHFRDRRRGAAQTRPSLSSRQARSRRRRPSRRPGGHRRDPRRTQSAVMSGKLIRLTSKLLPGTDYALSLL